MTLKVAYFQPVVLAIDNVPPVEFKKIEIVNFYNDVKWYFPKMKNGQLLATPTHGGSKPNCVYFVKEVSKQNEIIQLDKIL